MIKEFVILRPPDFPYRLISLYGYFYNNHHLINFHHAVGMDLIYEQAKICYVFPQNEFYQLLKLQNSQEPHDSKYNWLVMKGIFAGEPAIDVYIEIENEEQLQQLYPDNYFNKRLKLHRMLENDDEITLTDNANTKVFHHFLCNAVFSDTLNYLPTISMTYLQSYKNIYPILNLWFDEENKLMPLS
jgi:hypothetical protein